MTAIYANQVTNYAAARIAAYQAGSGSRIAFTTLVVGDGNGAIPSLSSMIAAGGVTHEVWRGNTIGTVAIDADNPQQIDVQCTIPAAVGGNEIGPFTVREFAILDEDGQLCIVGTALMEKTTSAQGAVSDLAWVAAIVVATTDAVVVTPPGAGFVTIADVQNAINAHQPTAQAPLTQSDTTDVAGWLHRVFGLRAARQPSAVTGSVVAEVDASGYGRPATQAEFDAGASSGGFAWPWATLQQLKAKFDALAAMIGAITIPTIPGAAAPLARNDALHRYEIAASSELTSGAIAVATQAQADAGVDDTTAITPKKLKQYLIDNPPPTPLMFPSWPVGSVVTALANITQDFAGRPRLGSSPAYPLVIGEDPSPLTPPYPQYLMTSGSTNLMSFNNAGALPGTWVYVGGFNTGQANFQRIS